MFVEIKDLTDENNSLKNEIEKLLSENDKTKQNSSQQLKNIIEDLEREKDANRRNNWGWLPNTEKQAEMMILSTENQKLKTLIKDLTDEKNSLKNEIAMLSGENDKTKQDSNQQLKNILEELEREKETNRRNNWGDRLCAKQEEPNNKKQQEELLKYVAENQMLKCEIQELNQKICQLNNQNN